MNLYWITITTTRSGRIKHPVRQPNEIAAVEKLHQSYPGGFEVNEIRIRKGDK